MLYVGSKYPSNVAVGSRSAKAVFRGSTPQWAPPWRATASYAVGDVVMSRGGFWECIKTHNSKNIYEPGSDYGSQDYYWRMYRQ